MMDKKKSNPTVPTKPVTVAAHSELVSRVGIKPQFVSNVEFTIFASLAQ